MEGSLLSRSQTLCLRPQEAHTDFVPAALPKRSWCTQPALQGLFPTQLWVFKAWLISRKRF